MKKLFAATVLATVFAASSAFALDVLASPQPIKGTEGPDISFRLPDTPQPSKGTEGPDVQFKTEKQGSISEPEGPDVQ